MVLRPVFLLLLMALPAEAQSRGTRIAMAVALLDVAGEHCTLAVDPEGKGRLMKDFHEYDIAGLASVLSQPLNAFYEDYLHQARQGREAFCRKVPAEAAETGYPVVTEAR